MRRILLSVILLGLFLTFSCEDKKDTTPPEVTIISPTSGSTVNEIVTITCMSTDNKGVDMVELWIDGVNTNVIDNTEPYSLEWNTTTYTDGNHTIVVRSYDTSDNDGDSEPLSLNVDNTLSVPDSVSIQSVDFSNGGFTINWTKSMDGDFKLYSLEHSIESQMNDYEEIYSTNDIDVTTTRMENISPLVYHYFRVTVTDTFDYQTKGSIYTSSLDLVPDSVDVNLVSYDLEQMTVEWEESQVSDFGSYKLLYSETESGNKDTLETYTDKTTTSYSTTIYDPTHENWFWIMVSDTFDQSSIGNGLTNDLDVSPTRINITSITYNIDEMVITWEQSSDWDFASYELMYSESEIGDKTTISTIINKNNTSYVLTEFDPNHENWFWVKVTDHWGQISVGNGFYVINTPPNHSELNPISYGNNAFNVSWSKNREDDFYSYQLFESLFENMSGENVVFESHNGEDTVYVVSGIGENERKYYRLSVTDIFELITSSSIVVGSSFPKIVFVSDRDGNSEIYRMDTDGGNQTRLTNNTSFDGLPQFSPDGLKIVFVSNRYGDPDIYIMDVNGRSQTNLTNSFGSESFPQISPDGSKIVFMSDGIFVMNTDGTDQLKLTSQHGNYSYPKFFPDGTKIAYQHHSYLLNILNEIYIMDTDGDKKIRLTKNEYGNSLGEISPDGSKIVFSSNRSGDNEIFVMNADGTEQINLTNNEAGDDTPIFSPDGTKIVYRSNRDGSNNEIYMMNIDGNSQTRLTNNEADEWRHSFSFDGSKILFVSNRDGNPELYIMNADGSNQTNLSNNTYADDYPQYQPQPD